MSSSINFTSSKYNNTNKKELTLSKLKLNTLPQYRYNATILDYTQTEKNSSLRKFLLGIELFQELKSKNVQTWDINELSQMDNDICKEIIGLIKKYHINFFGAQLVQEMKNEDKQEAIAMLDEGISPIYLRFILSKDKETRAEIIDIINVHNFTIYEISQLLYLDKETRSKAMEILKANNFNVDDMYPLLKYQGENFKQAIELSKQGFLSYDIRIILNNGQFNRAIELSKRKNMDVKKVVYLMEIELQYKDNGAEDIVRRLSKKDVDIYFLMNLVNIYKLESYGIENLTFEKKLELNELIKEVQKEAQKKNIFGKFDEKRLNDIQSSVSKSLKFVISPYPTDTNKTSHMMKNFFNNDDEVESLIKTFDFNQFSKTGLPLKYPRDEFLNDLSQELKGLNKVQKDKIFNKLEIKPIYCGAKLIGYNGVINPNSLNNQDEGKIKELCEDFIFNNEIQTDNEKMNIALNSLLDGIREFINIIGKEQNNTHSHTLDIHILKVLQNALNNSNYQELDDIDKTVLKFAIILHDIAKAQNQTDETHYNTSALFARNILDKFNLPNEVKQRICELVKNHHWLENYQNKYLSNNQIATSFRYKNDFKLAQIMANSDIKGVSDFYYRQYGPNLNSDNIAPIQESLDKINSTGQLLFTSKIINKNLIPKVKYNNQTYKVIDFTKMDDDFDLGKVGFLPNTKLKDIRLLIHTAQFASSLDNVKYLDDILNGGLLCASYISLNNKETYMGNKFGVGLEAQNTNIANANSSNQKSNTHKNFDRFASIATGGEIISSYRKLIANSIKKDLNLSDKEYAELYRKISAKNYLSQIKGEISLDGKIIPEQKLKNAILKAQDELLKENVQNEVNLYKPKITSFIAKVNSLSEIPQEFLNFAKENDLVIYLIGE